MSEQAPKEETQVTPVVEQSTKPEEVKVEVAPGVATETPKHPGGRPSECTPEVIIKAMEYVANYESLGDVVPSIEGLSIHIGVSRKTLYNWAEDPEKVEFLHIFESCMAKQGRTLLNKGLNGTFNSTISKLMLSKHGYVEKSESESHHTFDEPTDKDKAKLDAILNGPASTTTEQGSAAVSDTRDTSKPEVPVQ